MESSSEPDYTRLSERLKLLAHPERLRILDVLRREAECVCHLEALLEKPQPYVSQQLRALRQLGVIEDEKQGQNVFYHLSDPEIANWLDCVLGPALEEHPGIARHKLLISCGCPKCEDQIELSEQKNNSTQQPIKRSSKRASSVDRR